jgi:hypothetical protein
MSDEEQEHVTSAVGSGETGVTDSAPAPNTTGAGKPINQPYLHAGHGRGASSTNNDGISGVGSAATG